MSTFPVCWIQHGGEQNWAMQIARALADYGVRVHFVCLLRPTHEEYRRQGFCSDFIGELVTHGRTYTVAELDALDRRYGPPGLHLMAATQVALKLLYASTAPCLQVLARAYDFWERYLQTNGIRWLILRDTASFATRTAYHCARQSAQVGYVILNVGPADGYSSFCDVGEDLTWSELHTELARGVQPLTPSEQALVDDLVRARTAEKDKPARMRTLPTLKELAAAWYCSWREEQRCRRAEDPLGVAAERLRRRFLRQRAVWKFFTSWRFPYDQPQPGETYAYFPLFFQEEWLNLVGTHFWSTNMAAIIREVALSLPHDCKLYVKEHPAVPGDTPSRVLYELRRLPNVRIIHPQVNGQTLNARSAATVVLTGTSGWEAFLMQRPVVVLGNPWYSLSRLAYKVTDVNQLPQVLWQAITTGDAIYRRNENEWRWFIHRSIATSVRGSVYNFAPPFFSEHNLENSRLLARALVRKMCPERLGRERLAS